MNEPAERAAKRIAVTNLHPAQPIVDDRVLEKLEVEQGPRSIGQPAPVFLHVGDTPISEADIAREMQYHPSSLPEKSRAEAARALVVRELLTREIQRLGLAEASAMDDGEMSQEAAIRLLLEQTLEQRQPTDADCLRYFEQNREKFHAPDQIRVSHILLAAAPNDSVGRVDARKMADKLITDLQKQPWLFADFAQRYSRCPSHEQGGDLGWLMPGQTTAEFDRKVFRLPEGLAATPVETRWGYHIVKLEERRQGRPLAYVQVQHRIAEYLEVQVLQQEISLYLQKLQFAYQVQGLEEIEAAVPT